MKLIILAYCSFLLYSHFWYIDVRWLGLSLTTCDAPSCKTTLVSDHYFDVFCFTLPRTTVTLLFLYKTTDSHFDANVHVGVLAARDVLLPTIHTCKHIQNRSRSDLATVLPRWVTNYRPKPTGRGRKNTEVVYNVSHFSLVSSALNNGVPQLEFRDACVAFLGASQCVRCSRIRRYFFSPIFVGEVHLWFSYCFMAFFFSLCCGKVTPEAPLQFQWGWFAEHCVSWKHIFWFMDFFLSQAEMAVKVGSGDVAPVDRKYSNSSCTYSKGKIVDSVVRKSWRKRTFLGSDCGSEIC